MNRSGFFLFAALLSLAPMVSGQARQGAIEGRVLDETGAVISGATVELSQPAVGFRRSMITSSDGAFSFDELLDGNYFLRVQGTGFAVVRQDVTLALGGTRRMDVTLKLESLVQEVLVTAAQIASAPEVIPGSVNIIDHETMEASRVFTTSELLRKVPGLHVRDEEGLGLRPNIGIRGLNPTRSTKVLLLEDGIPFSYAPYGDNASYYHPPIDRFESVEIVKGSGQILYGPVTVGGVVNYITPAPPEQPRGSVTLTGGNRDYFNGHAQYGGTWGGTGLLFDFMRKQGEGARDNVRSGMNDLNAKIVTNLGARQALTIRGNYYGENSNITYSGLTQAEYLANPRQNPFRNDFFYGRRYGSSATHAYAFNNNVVITTNGYVSIFDRKWWRQSSNSGQRPNDSSDSNCGGMASLNTTCGIEGRLRYYTQGGVNPQLRVSHRLFGLRNESDFGLRAHFELQDRRQENGERPTSRTGTIVEDNERRTQAYSAFFQNRFLIGQFAVTPGIRFERIRYERTNRLANSGAGATGKTIISQFVPGIGVSYSPLADLTFFGGVHRGFAPARAEDIVSNTGGVIELDPELSWTYEAGVRTLLHPGARLEATFFRMDYENQVVPASLAGGVGAALTNGGKTLHQGAEFSGRLDMGTIFRSRHNVYARVAYTYVPTARFEGVRFSSVSGFSQSLITGNRLPYAPGHLVNASIGYTHARGFDALLEAVTTSDQFGDDLNSVTPSPDGQRGLISGYTLWNLAANYRVESAHATFFFTVKNLFDRLVIVDRSRGILPSGPRLFQTGLRFDF